MTLPLPPPQTTTHFDISFNLVLCCNGTVPGAGVQVLVMGFCTAGTVCYERPGLPWASHGLFQPAPMAPPPGMAGPSRQDGGSSGETVKKGYKMLDRQRKK